MVHIAAGSANQPVEKSDAPAPVNAMPNPLRTIASTRLFDTGVDQERSPALCQHFGTVQKRMILEVFESDSVPRQT